jgi:hypothetical protein
MTKSDKPRRQLGLFDANDSNGWHRRSGNSPSIMLAALPVYYFLEDSQTHVEQIQTRSYHPQISQIAAD